MRGGTVLRGYGCAGLAESVGTARYLSLDAATLEPVAEPLGGVGLLESCFEEGEAAARRGREDRLELRQDRDHEVDRALVPVPVLAEGQPAAGMDPAQPLVDMLGPPYVLPADARDIGDALAQQNEQHQRQVSLGADRVTHHIAVDFLERPCVPTAAIDPLQQRHILCDVGGHEFWLCADRPVPQ